MNTYNRLYRYQMPMGVLISLLVLGACAVSKSEVSFDHSGTLRIVTWNVQTLFDGDEAGTEYDDYRAAAGWTGEKYRARLNSLAQGIDRIVAHGPDLIGLMETENSQVLADLVNGPLAVYGYHWTAFTAHPGAALGIGVVSRFPLTETRVHSITVQGETIPRPLLEVRLQPQDTPVVLFICHWKSKLGSATESSRRASARVILRRLHELEQENPHLAVVIMGDLNENHDEFYRSDPSILSALLPDDPEAVERTITTKQISREQQDFLILSPHKPPRPEHFAADALTLYSPWGTELQGGSYYYQGAWETIDHFLLPPSLFDLSGWDFDTCMVINQEPFINAKGHPATYNPRTGNGLSDHLPLMLTLKRDTTE
ncbi:MAG: endonuclease/exonuclease/phosphatase family protein [Treponema sp.]|nr:endonuclease/exonuclease/phosphatase family protein [Treponema sp.]